MEGRNAEEQYRSYYSVIKRHGAQRLMRWMKANGFFEAPASRRHHGSFPGGLAIHSINVFERLQKIVMEERRWEYSAETTAIVSLLHDLCKIDAYEKTETGYRLTKHFPAGHGEKSVFLIQRFMRLQEEEILAIRWHMGQYDFYARGGGYDIENAFEQCRLVSMLHLADMEATHLDERDDWRKTQ